jgi:hypothetical protein
MDGSTISILELGKQHSCIAHYFLDPTQQMIQWQLPFKIGLCKTSHMMIVLLLGVVMVIALIGHGSDTRTM